MTAQTMILDLRDIDHAWVAGAGGKAANLGELSRIQGVRVPAGFCVTADAFRRILALAPIGDRLDELARLGPDDRPALAELSAGIRRAIEAVAIPGDLAAAITARLGDQAYAVRSSAPAEDGPTASFAGQHDSYLNIVGPADILRHLSRCWASLFTERAVAYRQRKGLDHRKAAMAVVVQEMVRPQAAGVLFTADPVSGDRKVCAIEAVSGLGESLVSGMVDADRYRVRDGAVAARTIQAQPALTDVQAIELAELGRRIEAHFGTPQDIEWCLAEDGFHIVQSRPITTLFPVPARDDGENHVYICVGHQQMMTDPMTPLGLSLFQLTALPVMHEAGGRLFVDCTARLAAPGSRAALLAMIGRSDALIGDALRAIVDRGDFVRPLPDEPPAAAPAPAPIATDPAIVAGLVAASEASLAALRRDIAAISGPEVFDFILADLQELKRILFDPLSHQAIMAGIEATWSLNDRLGEWLGETSAADILTQGASGNVTSQMGLDLLDLADVVRPHPQVVDFLRRATDEDLLGGLAGLAGGPRSRDAIAAWLDRYGMRCVGEIDIGRTRWSERPAALAPIILGHVRTFAPGEAARRLEAGRRAAADMEREVLERLRALPDGAAKADEARRLIDRVRTFIGYREYPKYHKVGRYFVYKQALMAEARRLADAGAIGAAEDVFHLAFQEFHAAARTGRVDERLVAGRRAAHARNLTLTPPRVLTSDGEAVAGAYRRDDLPPGALAGLPISAGVVEGRARVVRDLAEADLEPGDILVTAFTDPSWTPLFVAVAGLVTEVGGLMSHGSVIAREYGLPAVVGVEHATRLIRDGQRIRVHGTAGYVELLD